jgi:hypothetical protein
MPSKEEIRLELGRALTAEVAPEELPFFDELITYKRSKVPSRRDHELGFGGAEQFLTGAASVFLFQISETVLAFIWEQAQTSFKEVAKSAVKDLEKTLEKKLLEWIKSRFHKAAPVVLPADKRKALIELIRKDAVSSGVAEAELTRITTVLSDALTAKG